MEGWMAGMMDITMDGWKDGQNNGWKEEDGQNNVWMDEKMDRTMFGWMKGWTEQCLDR